MLFDESVMWRILTRFFEEPEREFFVKELAREIKISPGSASRLCKELEIQGILKSKETGRALFYSLVNDGPFVRRLKSAWFVRLFLEFCDCQANPEIQSIALYGSRASGEFISNSDIDILIISNVGKARLDVQFEKARKRFNEKLSLTMLAISDWRRLAKKKDRFYIEVLSNHILLSGLSLVVG